MKILKHIITLLTLVLISIASTAQNGINYKAIIKDGIGNVVANQNITVQFSILQSALLINVYTESHSPTTDVNGLIIINIGEGTLISGDYPTIDWSRDFHFLNVQIDTGSGLVDMGNSEFKTVPYALNSFTTNDHYWDKAGAVLFNASEKIGIGTNNPTGKTEISYPSTTLDPTLTLTQESGADSFSRINFGNNWTSNYWAVAARSETTLADSRFNIWNGTTDILSISGDGDMNVNGRITINNSTTYGLKVNSAVDHGILINTPSIYGISMGTVGNTGVNIQEATIGSGYYIGTAGLNGLTVNDATNNGVGINSAGLHGVFVSSAGVNGLQIDSAGNDGLRLGTIGNIGLNIDSTVNEGIYIASAGTAGVVVHNALTGNGFQVNTASVNGLSVASAGNNGVLVSFAGGDGVRIGTAEDNGVHVASAGDDGVHVASANDIGGVFVGVNAGVHAESSIDVNPDLILGGTANTGIGDNGIISSDPNYLSSDIFLRSYDAVVIQLDYDNNETGQFEIKNGAGTEVFEVTEAGNVRVNGSLVHASDRRLKKDIEELHYGLKEILQLQPKAYNWKNRTQETKSIGLIAQEVQPIIKEIVTAQDNEEKTLGISYTELIPILINAIKEQQIIIENQENNYSNLVTRLEALENKKDTTNNLVSNKD